MVPLGMALDEAQVSRGTPCSLIVAIALLCTAAARQPLADGGCEPADGHAVADGCDPAFVLLQTGMHYGADAGLKGAAPHGDESSTTISGSASELKMQQNKWFNWEPRFEKFRGRAIGDDGDRFVRAWTGLGKNWWMEFIDGFAHVNGSHAFDNKVDKGQNCGSFSEGAEREYQLLSSADAWEHRWNSSSLAQHNSRWIDRPCEEPDCLDAFSNFYVPRDQPYYWGKDSAVTTPKPFAVNKAEKKARLDEMLDKYYKVVDELASSNVTTRLRSGLPHLATLHMLLAELHPFHDGNSRLRTLLLHSELVRLGGHPVVMEDNGWEVYEADSLDAHVNNVLEGWCNWELIAATGHSPFVTPSLYGTPTYDAESGACRIGM